MFFVKELRHSFDSVPVVAINARRWKAHCDNPFGYVAQVQIISAFLVSTFILANSDSTTLLKTISQQNESNRSYKQDYAENTTNH